jgi:uncharacterized protein YraI
MKKLFLIPVLISSLVFYQCGEKKGQKNETKTDDKKTEKNESGEKSSQGENNNDKDAKEAVVVAKSGLSLRESASPTAKMITLLPSNAVVSVLEKGEEVTLKGKKSNWYKVKYGKSEGFAFGAYLNLGRKLKATNTATAKTASEGGEKTDFTGVAQKALVTANSGLVMRAKPNKSGKQIVTVPKNAEVGVLEFTENFETINNLAGSWCKVRYGKNEGYLFSAYLNFSTASILAKSGLTLRKEPTKDGTKITVIPSNAEVYLLNDDEFMPITATDENGGVWYKVRYGNKEGWAFGEFIDMHLGC